MFGYRERQRQFQLHGHLDGKPVKCRRGEPDGGVYSSLYADDGFKGHRHRDLNAGRQQIRIGNGNGDTTGHKLGGCELHADHGYRDANQQLRGHGKRYREL